MKRIKVRIQIQQASSFSDSSVLMLSEATAKPWKIPFNQSLDLRFGSGRQEVHVVPSSKSGVLRVNRELAAKWGLKQGGQLSLQYKSGTRSIHIGPLIGVLMSRVSTSSEDKPFGANTAFCRELTDACQVYGAMVFFCTPDDVQGQSDSVSGWRYEGKWIKTIFPVPNIIYNRLTSRKYENRQNVQQFVSRAKTNYDTVFFNEKYLNKTEVFDALRKETELQMLLPESYLLKNFTRLKSMCSKYPTVFLKPITGSLGKGIIRIQRQTEGSYICHFTNLGGASKQSFSSLAQLGSFISGKMKKQRYQIQQGLNLLTVSGRPIDFRALVQRGQTGQWSITSIVARIAGNHHFVSNLARGGTLSTVKNALARSGTAAADDGLAKLRRAALQIAKGIETQIPGHFAELGIDLALDQQGRVWLIEVNSKPSKEEHTSLSDDRKIRPSVRQIVLYSRYAAKY